MVALKILFICTLVGLGLACTPEPPPPDPGPAPTDAPTDPPTDPPTEKPNEDPVKKCLGDDAKDSLKEFINGDKSEAQTGADLNCDFTGATCSCWSNAVDEDELDWVAGDDADPDAIEECFPGVEANIDGEYLVIFSVDGEARKDKAILQSCTLECVKSGTISMDALVKDADLKVCVRKRSDSQANPDCEEVFDSGRVTVNALPATVQNYENIDLWLVAEGLGPSSIIIVDNVQVETVECVDSTTPPTTTPEPTTSTEAQTTPTTAASTTPETSPTTTAAPSTTAAADLCPLNCNFDSPCSSYQPDGTNGDTRGWRLGIDSVGNRDTGIRQSSTGTQGKFGGTEVRGRGSATLKIGPTAGGDGKMLQFRFYEATKNMALKLCNSPNPVNCLFSSELGVQESDRDWKTASVPLNGVDELYLICDNQGQNIGSCGFDSALVTEANGAPLSGC
jgi:hypothetical protein